MAELPVSVESISHLDGCHFYCWLLRMPDGRYEVTFDEREGSDLSLHAKGECERCKALKRGAEPRHLRRPVPDYTPGMDAKEGFFVTLATVGEIDAGYGGA